MYLYPSGPIAPGIRLHSYPVVPAWLTRVRSAEGRIEIHTPGKTARVTTSDSCAVGRLERLQSLAVRHPKIAGRFDSCSESHYPSVFDSLAATVAATISDTCPLKAVSPPQPASAASLAPGSRSDRSRASRVVLSK